jgi:NAD(P)-dependent dehydrogenase (short-subunit alcohol dehydrogenase family)
VTERNDAEEQLMGAGNEDGRFAGKVAFVTGAASGIGRAAALAFARAGVVVADVADDGNQETARMIEESGGRALAVSCDVTRSQDVKAALDRAVDAFGRLVVASNNAGVEKHGRRRRPDHVGAADLGCVAWTPSVRSASS